MNNNFKNNIDAIRGIFPKYAEYIESQINIKQERFMVSGEDQLYIDADSGWTPAYDASKIIESAQKIAAELPTDRTYATCIVGVGRGHMVNEILKKYDPFHKVIAVECNPYLICKMFEKYDFSENIKRGQLFIACPSKDEIGFVLSIIDSNNPIHEWYITTEPYAGTLPEYVDILQYCQALINSIRCNVGTVSSSGAAIALNDIRTLPFLLRRRGINELAGLFKGKPAIYVNTGPSLEKNIDLLIEAQDEIIIIAVAQAMRILLAYGIRPDFICSVDFGEVNQKHFDGLMDQDIPLIALNRLYYGILERYRGPIFASCVVEGVQVNRSQGLLKDKGMLDTGGSVSHMALQLALHLGCNPVATIGQDLALTDKSHFPLADASGVITKTEQGELRWEVKDPRSGLDKGSHSMGPVLSIPGYYGDVVTSNTGLMSFITTFAAMAANASKGGIDVYNCTEGGARIENMIPRPLEWYLDNFCKESIDKKLPDKLLTEVDNASELWQSAKLLTMAEHAMLKELKEQCTISINSLNKAHTARKRNNKIKHIEAHNESARKAQVIAESFASVNLIMYAAKRNAVLKQYRIKPIGDERFIPIERLIDNKEDFKVLSSRALYLLSAAKDAANDTIAAYEKILDYFNHDHAPIPLGETANNEIADFDKYLDAGNWALPLLQMQAMDIDNPMFAGYLKRVNELKINAINRAHELRKTDKESGIADKAYGLYLLDKAHKIGQGEDKRESLILQREAFKLLPNMEYARWGLASALSYHVDENNTEYFDEAYKMYCELIKDYPDKARYLFERGLLQTQAGKFDDGIKDILTAMDGYKNFVFFMPKLARLFYEHGDYDKGREVVDEYCKLNPEMTRDLMESEAFNHA